jgi:hypothetical protein
MTNRLDGDRVEVEVPGYRADIEREVDLIEEVVRIQGYDNVGSTMPRAPHPGGVPETYAFARRVKGALAARRPAGDPPGPVRGRLGSRPVLGHGRDPGHEPIACERKGSCERG